MNQDFDEPLRDMPDFHDDERYKESGSPLTFHITMTAELKVDCYDGENFDEHRKYWNAYCEGDKQDEDLDGSIEFDPSMYPPGTRITIEEPLCPKCQELHDCCSCGFDWKEWAADLYA